MSMSFCLLSLRDIKTRELALEKQVKELNNIVFKRNQSTQTVHMLTKSQFFYDHSTRQALGFQNPCYLKRAQQLEPNLYDGSVIQKTDAIVIRDSKKTLMLEDESRSKMLQKQKDQMISEKKVNTKPIDYAALNQLSTDFKIRFVPQTELSAEQAFWSRMVNSSLKKLKFHLASFDVVVKERTTATTITEGTWGFEHTKACFKDEIIPFVKALKDLFNSFNQFLIDELTEVQNVFNQIEQVVKQHCVEKNKFQDKMNDGLKENERFLEQVISADIVNIVVHANVNYACKTVNECERCVTIKTELQRDFIKKKCYDTITTTAIVPLRKPIPIESNTTKPVVTLVYSRKSKAANKKVPVSNSKINKSLKFLGTVKFENDHVAKIMGYGDYQIENVTISRVYFVEGLGHNLFSVGQFCDSDLEVAFRQHTCFIRNLDGFDLLTGSRGNNLYTLSLQDMVASSPICLLAKALKTKSWLWHRHLSHLNFGAINHLARQGLVRGLPKLKFEKDHLCSACAMDKSKKKSHKPKSEDTNQEKQHLLHMDLCGLMRVESVNGKKHILIIVDDYSRFTWVKCLRSKDEAPDFIIKNDWDLLFQPMFDELLNPSPSVDPQALEVIALIADTTTETQSSVIPQDVKEDIHDIEVAHMGNDSLFGVPIPEVTSAQSSLTVSPHTIVQFDHQIPQHNSKWIKDHPLDNIIGQLSRPVL
nr:integrase, catalytic region, zinc finger, CCHC-type, peptidase aspartic, catalytic [Tanacetum cinerariifolium]